MVPQTVGIKLILPILGVFAINAISITNQIINKADHVIHKVESIPHPKQQTTWHKVIKKDKHGKNKAYYEIDNKSSHIEVYRQGDEWCFTICTDFENEYYSTNEYITFDDREECQDYALNTSEIVFENELDLLTEEEAYDYLIGIDPDDFEDMLQEHRWTIKDWVTNSKWNNVDWNTLNKLERYIEDNHM